MMCWNVKLRFNKLYKYAFYLNANVINLIAYKLKVPWRKQKICNLNGAIVYLKIRAKDLINNLVNTEYLDKNDFNKFVKYQSIL